MKHRLLVAAAVAAATLTAAPAASARSYDLSLQANAIAGSYLQVAADYWSATPECYSGIYVDAADRRDGTLAWPDTAGCAIHLNSRASFGERLCRAVVVAYGALLGRHEHVQTVYGCPIDRPSAHSTTAARTSRPTSTRRAASKRR